MGKRTIDVVIPVDRDARRATTVVDALLRCDKPEETSVRIVLVDDGSGDDTADTLVATHGEYAEVVRLPKNRGRSSARNAGSLSSEADFLLFLDSDCVPVHGDFLSMHVETMRHADISIGSVMGMDDGFWHDYQSRAIRRRERLADSAPSAVFTTQNVMIARAWFTSVGGFDEAYSGYGFEDRDLALRLIEAGARAAVTHGALVSHRDKLSLRGVCLKMCEAGKSGSARFAARHPEEYRGLGFAAIDARIHPWRGMLGRWIVVLGQPMLCKDGWLQCKWLPMAVRAGLVRVLVASHYLLGTQRAD